MEKLLGFLTFPLFLQFTNRQPTKYVVADFRDTWQHAQYKCLGYTGVLVPAVQLVFHHSEIPRKHESSHLGSTDLHNFMQACMYEFSVSFSSQTLISYKMKDCVKNNFMSLQVVSIN